MISDELRILEAIRIAQDITRAWALATPEQRKRMVWSVFNRILISGGAIASVRPKPETAALLAAAVHRCGPDRGLTRNGEVRIHGVIVEEIEDLLELARARVKGLYAISGEGAVVAPGEPRA